MTEAATQSDSLGSVVPEVREFIGHRTHRMLIDGQWVTAASGETF